MDSQTTATSSGSSPLIGGKKEEKPKASELPKAAKADKAPRKSKKKLIILIAAAAAIITGAVVALIILLNLNKGGDGETVFDTDAFFIRETRDSSSKYALFKNDGSRLTDFVFSFGGVFVNNHAIVRNEEDQYGIIDHTGKITVDFGTYERIYELDGLFEVKSGDNAKIIKGNGDDVIEGYKAYKNSYNAPYVAVETEEDQYKLFNAYGDQIADFESKTDPTFETRDKRVATSIAFDGHLMLLNNKTLKVAANVETDMRYVLSDASVNEKAFVFSKEEYENRTMAYLIDGKFYDLDKKCSTITINDDESNKDRYYLTCKNENGTFLIRDNQITDIPISDYNNHYVIYDENRYGRYDSKESEFHIFVNGEEKKTVNAGYTPSVTRSGYSIRDYKNKMIALYDTDGNIIYKLDGITYGDLYGVDENGNIIVRDPRESKTDSRFYLVDKDGNIVSEKYASIARRGKFYSAYRYEDKKSYLLGGDGKVIVEGDYSSFDFYKKNTVIFGRKDGQYDLVDTDGKSIKVSEKGSLSVSESGYFTISNDDEMKYYTHSGNQFYTQK